MDNIIPTNEYTEFEGRYYANPQVSLDRSNQFIDNLRATQGTQNQEIAQQTYNLGTEVPSNLGGLTGANSYFTSRYQTPQTNAVTANLRAIAQAQALNDVLANEQEMWKKRYQDAYRAYQRSTHNKTYSSNGTGGDSGNQSLWSGEPKIEVTDEKTEDETSAVIPPNPYSDEFNITGEEQTKRISERSNLPEWLVNSLKIMTNP